MSEWASAEDDSRRVSIILVDDQSLLREGLRTLLELQPDLRIVGEASDGIAAEALVERLHPDVVLMDLRMPRRDGVEATRRIVDRWPGVQVLVLTTFDDDELVFQSIKAGATGYLLKDVGSDALAEAVRAANRGESPIQPSVARKLLRRLRSTRDTEANHQGHNAGASAESNSAADVMPPRARSSVPGPEPFTQRERDILKLLGSGATNREIAERLCLSDGTVKNYVSTLLGKTGLRDRTGLAVWAVHHGLV